MSYEVDPAGARREPDQGLVRPRGAGAAAEERRRGHPGRRLHAGSRRLPARRDDPRASALPADRDHLHLGHPAERDGSPARLRNGRGRLRAGAGRARGPARQGQGVRRALSQDAPARGSQSSSSSSACPSEPRNWRHRTRGCAKASAGAAWRWRPATWVRGTGISPAATCVWDEGQSRICGVDPARSFRRSKSVAPLVDDADWERLKDAFAKLTDGSRNLSDRTAHPPARRRNALVHRDGGGDVQRRRADGPAQRRHRRHHRSQGGGGTPASARPRGRSPRPQCARRRPRHRPAQPGELDRGLCRGDRGTNPRAGADACAAVAVALAGRRYRPTRRRGIGAVPDRPCGQGAGGRRILRPAGGEGADRRACAARAGNQRREIRRAVLRVGPGRRRTGASNPAGSSCSGGRPAVPRSSRRCGKASVRRS